MKYLLPLLFVFLSTFTARSQGFGVSFGGASSKSFLFDVFYKKNLTRYYFGISLQRNGQLGQSKSTQLSNYGRSVTGQGEHFQTFDFKYGRVFKEKFVLIGEISLGSDKAYTNYSDNRFSAGGYHLIRGSFFTAGIGIGGNYIVEDNVEIGVGYNTKRGVGLLLAFSF